MSTISRVQHAKWGVGRRAVSDPGVRDGQGRRERWGHGYGDGCDGGFWLGWAGLAGLMGWQMED